MIYALASFSNENYKLYQTIVYRCEKGKDKKTKKSSLGLSCNKTDCKGSNFRGLRGLTEDEMTDMLQKCANGEISLQKINLECSILKKIKTIKEAFMGRVGCVNWLQTVEQYGHFADENILRDLFIELKFSPNVPAAFNEYCAKALK